MTERNLPPEALAQREIARRRIVILKVAIPVGVLMLSWLLTATWGVATVNARVVAPMLTRARSEGFTILDRDPGFGESIPMPWAFAEKPSSRFPFVVSIDEGSMFGPLHGSAQRHYYFWFFGLLVEVHCKLHWTS